MIYKFDILFRKSLADGGTKVVTYSTMLENPNAFGEGETLEGVTGELSLVKEGAEKGFSLNSLLRKYHSLLVGRLNSETWGKEFPLQFGFGNFEDASSIKAELKDESGYLYSSKVETRTIQDDEIIDLTSKDTFVMVITKEGSTRITDEIGTSLCAGPGEAVFVTASTNRIELQGSAAVVKIICSE